MLSSISSNIALSKIIPSCITPSSMTSSSSDTFEIDYKSLFFFDTHFETEQEIVDKIVKGENKLANKIRTKLHQDVNKKGFIIILMDDDVYNAKVINVITKMLEAQEIKLIFHQSDVTYKYSSRLEISYTN